MIDYSRILSHLDVILDNLDYARIDISRLRSENFLNMKNELHEVARLVGLASNEIRRVTDTVEEAIR